MNPKAKDALERYRNLKNGLSAMRIVADEMELTAWKEFLDSLHNDQDKEETTPYPGRCCP